jgi:hypothetical protein
MVNYFATDRLIKLSCALAEEDEGSHAEGSHLVGNRNEHLNLETPLLLTALLTGVFAIFTLGFVSAWARGNTQPTDDTYGAAESLLGYPNWKTNLFAWHAVLMTAYFVSQVFAFVSWSIIKFSRDAAKIVHVIFHFAGIATMISGMVAVVSVLDESASPEVHVTTPHQYVGVISLVVFGLNFLLGSTMGIYTVSPSPQYRESKAAVGLAMIIIHKIFGI